MTRPKRNGGDYRKHNRARLFAHSKPTLRPATREDLVWIRVNQKLEGVEMADEEFDGLMHRTFSQYHDVVIIEDSNTKFGEKFGPVGLVASINTGPIMEPHVEWFSWATPRNILRGAVAFFQMYRYRHTGTLIVHCLDDARDFFKRLKKYATLFYVGCIPGGDVAGRGDDYVFYQRCREYERNI